MEEAGRKHGAGSPGLQCVGKVGQFAGAAAGDDRDADRVAHGAGQADVVADLGAVAVHAGEEDLAGAEFDGLTRPRDRIESRRVAPAVGVHPPGVAAGLGLGVDREDDALGAEALRDGREQAEPAQ